MAKSESVEEVFTHVSPALHPQNVESIPNYEQHKGYLAGVTDCLTTMYESLASVHKARLAVERDPTKNEAGRLITVGDYALKQQDAIAKKVDTTIKNLNSAITGMEDMLTTPLTNTAATGPLPTEIRAHVKGLPLKDRQKFLNDAQAAGDVQTLAAVLGAPPYLSGIMPAEKTARTRAYHEAKSPETVHRLEAMRAGRDMMMKRSALVHGELEKAIGASWSKLRAVRNAKSESDKAFSLVK